jgi:hypothetical protein
VRIFHERPYKYSKQAVERIKAFREKIA